MKTFWKMFPIVLCSLLMAAHFGRANLIPLQIVSIFIPFLLFWKNKISARIVQVFLFVYGLEWIRTIFYYARIRTANGENWSRLAIILGVVALLNFATTLVFRTKSMKEKYEL